MKKIDEIEALSRLKLKYNDVEYEGILIPSPDKDFFTLKLDNGYNVGLKKENAEIIEINDKVKSEKTASKYEREIDNSLPDVSLLHTGGTIASKVDYKTGGVIAGFDPEELLQRYPEIAGFVNLSSRLVRNIQSEMIRFDHYNLLAEEIKKEIENGAKGIILTQGTDTLHYTSAALSFVLRNLNVPVVIVGAQRSSDRPSTDAKYNLVSAVYFISEASRLGVGGVFVCMHENTNDNTAIIIRGTQARKMHSTRRDAFRPVNSKAFAYVNFQKEQVIFNENTISYDDDLKLMLFNPKIKVGLIKTHPHMFADEFLFYKDYDGLIMEGTGLGHIPNMDVDEFTSENDKIQESVKKMINDGVVVALTSQTIYGRINLNVYSPQRMLKDIGVLGHMCDMTPETAYIKLAWLLSNYDKDNENKTKVKELYETNIIGEISERIENEDFLN